VIKIDPRIVDHLVTHATAVASDPSKAKKPEVKEAPAVVEAPEIEEAGEVG
jgi:hypothetical protein